MGSTKKSIGVLLTCHNRINKTLKCLDTLFSQKNINKLDISVYLVDDGGTDGTAEAVEEKYPQINILKGDGSLYWTGGMRKAMDAAMEEGYDFYLWLNDDTVLYPNALQKLFEIYERVKKYEDKPPIISGNLWDPIRNEVSYGGYIHSSNWHPLRFKRLKPCGKPRKCDVINGNVVLLPSEVVEEVGNLHPKLKHAKGDYEYALRAYRKGFSSWITDKYVGECPRNFPDGTWKDDSLSLINKYKKLLSEKGEPFYPRMIYYSEYGGFFWPVFFLGVYLRPVLYSIEQWWNNINKK